MSPHGLPWLCFEPLELLNFYLNANPDPAHYSNANPDPALYSNADPDPAPKNNATMLGNIVNSKSSLHIGR